jgi:DNA-directed RNA polymerase specialized sigma24 family protein
MVFRRYDGPILAFIRSSNLGPQQEAEDLKQAFFMQLLLKDSLKEAVASGLRLRVFLVTKLQGFLIDHYRRSIAQKRGSGRVHTFADLSQEQRRVAEPMDFATPLVVFQRRWLETLAANALESLRQRYETPAKLEIFDALVPYLTGNCDHRIAELAAKLGRKETTIRSDIARLRRRCQSLIRAQVADTLVDPAPGDIDAELADLMGYGG